jgi:hypothetical protein
VIFLISYWVAAFFLRKKRHSQAQEYESDFPPIAVYREQESNTFEQLFAEKPEALVNFCPVCGAKVRIEKYPKPKTFDTITGEVSSETIRVFCGVTPDHFSHKIVRERGKKKKRLLQNQLMEVVEASSNLPDNQLKHNQGAQ